MTRVLFLLIVLLLAEIQFPSQTASGAPLRSITMATATTHQPLAVLATLVRQCAKASQPVLLGSRDPNGPSCVTMTPPKIREDLASTPGDWDGGPGTSLATLYFLDRDGIKSAQQDFNWHQKRLKAYLENHSTMNVSAEEKAHALAEQARLFWQQSTRWKEFPTSVHAVVVPDARDWLSYCLSRLNRAVAAKDLVSSQRWSGELASAAFSLEDLHRWLDFLERNQLTALEFQRDCGTLFPAADRQIAKYDPKIHISQFPAGILSLNGIANYIEVERQAERFFSTPKNIPADVAPGANFSAGSLWVSPDLRETFLKLQLCLSPNNQKVWNQAARSNYDHSFLINILFRTVNANATDHLCQVLKKFDQLHPAATVSDLLSVVMYRGHPFAGLEWADRFQPELIKSANSIKLSESNLQALKDACTWTHNFYLASKEYGMTLTLRDALDQKKLDCVRATDMIAAIYANAGRPGFCTVRWSGESTAHSVAGFGKRDADGIRIQLLDGLNPTPEPEQWPSAYFHGHAWPPTLGPHPDTPYAAEVYVRGLDSYVWMQGYIIRGPHAGWLTAADIPYGIFREPASTKKVFNGPYPGH